MTLTRNALDRLQLTAIAKVSYITQDFYDTFESQEIKDFPYQELDDAELLRQIQNAGDQPIPPQERLPQRP